MNPVVRTIVNFPFQTAPSLPDWWVLLTFLGTLTGTFALIKRQEKHGVALYFLGLWGGLALLNPGEPREVMLALLLMVGMLCPMVLPAHKLERNLTGRRSKDA
jgi:hypothetical protein